MHHSQHTLTNLRELFTQLVRPSLIQEPVEELTLNLIKAFTANVLQIGPDLSADSIVKIYFIQSEDSFQLGLSSLDDQMDVANRSSKTQHQRS
ncbi:hypothetical protein PHET_11202 [Paragonimus heterotremus]|uniref:Uncharacterized protein n=1 Tax=Paragonimus heterotremus TaxID=100268 RepID=A0A8J4T684_9TREM|nr:hypothetical protein PHET_11202 [Paragonimus heterotremus]